jgi:hypothetical protein
MKKIILVLTIGLLFLSCSSSPNDSSSSSSVYKWSFKLDGVLYKWKSGESIYDDAFNHYKSGNSVLKLQKDNLSVSILFPNSSTGNFIINNSTWQSSSMKIFFQYTNLNIDIYRTDGGAVANTMNVNVSSLSINSGSLNPGKAIGTFSGTIQNPDGNISTITDGSFSVEASEY